MFYLFGLAIISSGVFKFSDAFMAATSLLLAVAVRATTGTEGNVAHNIANLEWSFLKSSPLEGKQNAKTKCKI